MTTTWHDTIECPNCQYRMNGSSGINTNDSPRPGDITVCAQCRTVLTYGDGLHLTEVTDPNILASGEVLVARIVTATNNPHRHPHPTNDQATR